MLCENSCDLRSDKNLMHYDLNSQFSSGSNISAFKYGLLGFVVEYPENDCQNMAV